MGLNAKGRNWGQLINWDDLGKFYAAFIIAWTVLLYAGAVCLVWNRRLAFIKIRNLPLAIAAVSFLHVYLVKIFLAYTTNGHFLCSAEFWIMSIYLPFGIALFQANLIRLKSISDQQRQLLAKPPSTFHKLNPSVWGHARAQWQSLRDVQKSYLLVGYGMLIQLVITAVLYATTPTLQNDYTSYGPVTHDKGQALCRKSPQWIPSAFWQLAWAWLYGPYILFSVRNIHDTHYWRLQVIVSVISGLSGTPLWLAAVFSTAFVHINPWFVPPMWLAPGIIVMQFTTIFFPVYEIYQSRSLMRTTLAILEAWEDKKNAAESERYLTSSSSSHSLGTNVSSSKASSRLHRELCSMSSLEKALAVNPDPLLHFAATKDFTAENILFLVQVSRWRQAFQAAPCLGGAITDVARSHFFESALQIYMDRVCERTTKFPINIEWQIRRNLDNVFASAIPANVHRHNSDGATTRMALHSYIFPVEKAEHKFEPHPAVAPLGISRAMIRDDFSEDVFNAAEKSIKYLVLTNTWQKFVKYREEKSSWSSFQC
ncbi:hypothetical protein EDD37DRAFT_592989 [Exophiala viscosa]|uniref:uncharacterized protein n=1 Tax=Exophiala viscosa TaxID=2486360 RepID=UPI0021996A24|nr:hypothetical protein EDD37DRAFT_592989 [Exophiala viscosa]